MVERSNNRTQPEQETHESQAGCDPIGKSPKNPAGFRNNFVAGLAQLVKLVLHKLLETLRRLGRVNVYPYAVR